MATKKPTTSERLEQARADLQTIEQQIDDIETTRATALLSDNDREATALGLRLDEARQVARTITDKCALLEIEVEKEKAAAERRRHQQHVDEFEKVLGQADAKGDELQATVEELEKNFREVIRLRELALSMWPHGKSSHGDALVRSPGGAALAAGAVSILLQHELHRVGSEAPLGGKPGEQVKVKLPGGAPERLTPEVDRRTGKLVPLVPLAEKLRKASAFAVSTLRNDLFVPAVVPQPEPVGPRLVFDQSITAPVQQEEFSHDVKTQPRQPAPAPAPVQPPEAVGDIDPLREYIPPEFRERLATLLRKQMQLAAGDDDKAYERCVAETAALQAEIERARNAA
jgi:hypothetical protein